jgi:hypothetical protein
MAYLGLSNDVPDAQRAMPSQSSSHRSEKEEFQDIFSELMTGTEHEIAFLTRHYSEVLGPWYVYRYLPFISYGLLNYN